MAITDTDRKRIETWCREQTPAEHADKIRIEATFRGNSAAIMERRPPWREDFGPEWSERRAAKLTWDPAAKKWTLFSLDRNDRLMPYSEQFGLSGKLMDLLDEIDKDPTCIFWG